MKHTEFDAVDDDEVAVCPTCDRTPIQRVSGSEMFEHEHKRGEYVCRSCGETFDTFTTRKRKQRSIRPKGLAGRLADADPDEVGR
jgi:transposase-like protein